MCSRLLNLGKNREGSGDSRAQYHKYLTTDSYTPVFSIPWLCPVMGNFSFGLYYLHQGCCFSLFPVPILTFLLAGLPLSHLNLSSSVSQGNSALSSGSQTLSKGPCIYPLKKVVRAHHPNIFLNRQALHLPGDLNHCPREE